MINKNKKAMEALEEIVGRKNIDVNPARLEKTTENTLGISRKISGVIYPSTTEEVQGIINIANKYGLKLYPISSGKNIGYGDKLPVTDGQIIVDLYEMDKITDFDNTHGHITIEPGVTQARLHSYLDSHNSNFIMDATGAGLKSSIIGNTLEGGFGHTPMGNHRETITDTEIVLGNGIILQTGTFPGLGPDLSGIFVQSNFGIVTKMKIELMPIPDYYESFFIKVSEDNGLEPLVKSLSELRKKATLTSLVHIANATRSLMTTKSCPQEYRFKGALIDCKTAQEIMSSPLAKVGYWGAIGGIYGSREEVMARKRDLKKSMKGIGKIMYSNDLKLKLLKKMVNSGIANRLGITSKLKGPVESLEYIHNLGKGVPSDTALDNILWKEDKYEDMGLIWYAPKIPATGKTARKVVAVADDLYKKYGFEMPITMTLVKPDQLVGVLNISFNKKSKEETGRAHALYHELNKAFSKVGIYPYRTGTMGMPHVTYLDKGKEETLKLLKKTLDPNNVIAPGRYNI